MLRTGLAAVLLIVFLSAMVLANTSAWALRTVLDPAAFAVTTERALETPALESLVASTTADAIIGRLAQRAPTDLQSLAVEVLGLDPGASRTGIARALAPRIQGVLEDATVRRIRLEVIASIHGYVSGTLEGTPGLITIRGGDVVLDPSRLLDRITAVADPGLAAAAEQAGLATMPPVVIAQVAELRPIQRTIGILQALQVILPLVAVAVALLIVIVAHRRERALGIVGVAVAVAGIVSLVAIWFAGAYVTRIPDAAPARTITAQVYDAFVVALRDQAIVLVIAGLVILAVAWVLGRRARRRAVVRMLGPRGTDPGAGT